MNRKVALAAGATSHRPVFAAWFGCLRACFLWSWLSTRRRRGGSWTVYPLMLLLSSCLVHQCWLFGSSSTLFMMMLPVLVLAASLLLDPRIGWIAIGLTVLDWGGLATLEILDAVSYAPALRDRSIDALVTPGWLAFLFGTVDSFSGNAIMILFGAPESAGERHDAVRAVRMSQARQARMIGLREEWSRQGISNPPARRDASSSRTRPGSSSATRRRA